MYTVTTTAVNPLATLIVTKFLGLSFFILGRFNKKHIMCGSSLMKAERTHKEILNWCHKVRWRWHFKDDSSPPLLPLRRRRSVIPCPMLTTPPLTCWLSLLQSKLNGAVHEAFNRHRYNRQFSTVTNLVTFGLKLLKTSNFIAIQTDKDGGMGIESINDVRVVIDEVLARPEYAEIPVCNRPKVLVEAVQRTMKMAVKIEQSIGPPGIASAIRRYLREDNATIVSKLKLTLKSHKEAGEVSHRALHATPNYMLMGLGLWVQMMCQKRLADSQYNHILKDASGFISDIRAIKMGPTDFFVKVDFKDFYMSGEPKQIADDVTCREPELQSRTLFRDAVLILLESQFLEAEAVAERLFLVIKGSGMRLVHSGFLTDLALANKAEVNWAASKHVREQHGIKGGWRFRDDSLWVCTNATLAEQFFKEYAKRSEYFVLKIEETRGYMMRS